MKKRWKQSGVFTEEELMDDVQTRSYPFYIAYCTDQFKAGRDVRELPQELYSKILELRLFSEEEEYLARRTMIGENHPFQWRIACEKDLTPNEYLVRYQTLDIDQNLTRPGKENELLLTTTGGGHYSLPIDKNQSAIRVISYIDYSDEDGMAFLYDHRYAGFSGKGEEVNG